MAKMSSKLLDYDPYNPLPTSEGQGWEKYLRVDSFFMAPNPEKYTSNIKLMALRDRALLVIFKYSKCENFDPIIPYLAITYFDRLHLFSQKVMGVTVEHDLELLALCCLTLAWKLRNRNFNFRQLQEAQPDLSVVTQQQLKTMELHVLDKLDWRLRAVTPLCYLPFFEPRMDPTCGLQCKSIRELIIQSIIDRKFIKYKPSLIAASTIVAASFELNPNNKHSILFFQLVAYNTSKHQVEHPTCVDVVKLVDKFIPKIGLEESQARSANNKGKEEALEMTMKTQKTAEDSEDTQLDFPLTWGLRVAHGEKFAIFQCFKLNGS